MNSNPLVSCITPFLNEQEFIEEAILSVLAQTHDNWELLLIDDGSTDASIEVARRYAEQYPEKVRYLEHEGHQNRGTSASRNLGLRKARGEYIAFLDADDLWLPDKLRQQVPILLSQPKAAVVYGPTFFWHYAKENSVNTRQGFVQELGVRGHTLVEPPMLLILLLQNEDIHPANCSLLVRRQLFDDVGEFEETFRMYEDTIFLAKAFLKAQVFVTDECSAIYRLHPNSTCHVAMKTGEFHASQPNAARGNYLRWLEAYLGSQGVVDARLWGVLQPELAPYAHATS